MLPLLMSRACNHDYEERKYDAKCRYCPSVIPLSTYRRLVREKEKKKRQPPPATKK